MSQKQKAAIQRRDMPIGPALSSSMRPRLLGLTLDDYIHYFFRGNAAVAILILLLIMLFLFKEGAEYMPDYKRSYQLYRQSGMEFVGIARDQLERHQQLLRSLHAVQQSTGGAEPTETQSRLGEIGDVLKTSIAPQQAIVNRWVDRTTRLRNIALDNENLHQAIRLWGKRGDSQFVEQLRKDLKPVDYEQTYRTLRKEAETYHQANRSLIIRLNEVLRYQPVLGREGREKYDNFVHDLRAYVQSVPRVAEAMDEWDPEKPVQWYRSLSGFLLGKRWVTNSFWQDFYGIIPLFSGSLMISTLALLVAVPLALAAAIYANQIARPFELKIIKPYIEFITAIPSIVLGFFGIVVLGSFLQEMSGWQIFSWIPGFPIPERLNIATAGLLLALMAIPTIFTLVEDSLNNVPRQYLEASYALGATRLQTIFKIMIPAALSGIIAAILLGLGRVIGETMVVLLCAGNRLAIPDFSQGIGAFFEPAHTMTGIIAQEMGEVPPGSVHYRALFMVGIVLFMISLAINYLAQLIVRKFRIAE
jgi:phosphate transport system permease protein